MPRATTTTAMRPTTAAPLYEPRLRGGGAGRMAAPAGGHIPGQGEEAGVLTVPLEAGDAAWEGVPVAALAITRPPTSPPPMRPAVTARMAQRRRHPLPAADGGGGGGGGGGGQSGGGGGGHGGDDGRLASKGFSAVIGSPPAVIAGHRIGRSTLRWDDSGDYGVAERLAAGAHRPGGGAAGGEGGIRTPGGSSPHRFSRAAPSTTRTPLRGVSIRAVPAAPRGREWRSGRAPPPGFSGAPVQSSAERSPSWSRAPHWKCGIRGQLVSRVRIPLAPP